jgi:hypothetical protein
MNRKISGVRERRKEGHLEIPKNNECRGTACRAPIDNVMG